MALWIAPAGGNWHNSANWDNGDVPDFSFETASFVFATNSGGSHFIDLAGGTTSTISALNVTLTGSTGMVIRGSTSDGGAASLLRFDGGAGNATVTINTAPGGGGFLLSDAGDNYVFLATRTIFNVVNAGSIATISVSIGGSPLVKTGAGTLVLTNNNNGIPEAYIEGGTFVAPTSTIQGGSRYYLSNGSTLQISGAHNGGIRTTGSGGGTVLVPTGQTLTLSSLPLSHLTSGRLTLGSATDQGTILVEGSASSDAGNANQTILVAGGTLRLNRDVAAESFPNAGGGIEIRNGAVVESAYAMRMHNLVLNNGTVRVFDSLEITATTNALTVQNGTYEGNAGVNRITVNVEVNYSLAGASFVNWTAGVDVITMNGNAANNIIVGSLQNDIINGGDGTDVIKGMGGNDTLNGGGGVDQIRGGTLADTINGGDGNDKILGFGGADVLTGGAGRDQFRYILATDSGIDASADLITDFAIGQDLLNFLLLDADVATAGDQAFSFIGTAAFANTGVGQIRYANSGADLLVQADVNGDGVADMAIILQGQAGGTLTAANFIL